MGAALPVAVCCMGPTCDEVSAAASVVSKVSASPSVTGRLKRWALRTKTASSSQGHWPTDARPDKTTSLEA
eukprot:8409342-Lingulodinium_polyedra.AAC.1